MVLAKACAINRKRGKNLLAADNRAFAVKPISVETMIDKVNSMLLESAMVVSSKQE